MEPSCFYIIKNRLTNLCLTIKDSDINCSTSVICQPDQNSDSQLWFFDPIRCRIRAKINPRYVLDLNTGYGLIINRYSPGSPSQKWLSDGKALCCSGLQRVCDVKGVVCRPGMPAIAYKEDGGKSQQWRFKKGQYFVIKSDLNELVLTVDIGDSEDGDKALEVRTQPCIHDETQLWSINPNHDTVQLKADEGLVLGVSRKSRLVCTRYNSRDSSQRWTCEDDLLRCSSIKEVATVSHKKNNSHVYTKPYTAEEDQRWNFQICCTNVEELNSSIENVTDSPYILAIIRAANADLSRITPESINDCIISGCKTNQVNILKELNNAGLQINDNKLSENRGVVLTTDEDKRNCLYLAAFNGHRDKIR